MAGFKQNIEKSSLGNTDFRQVIYTGKFMQLVLMSLKPNEEIGMEVHDNIDQFFRFEKGNGKVIIEGEEMEVGDGDVVVIPAGSQHNIINTSSDADLKLYTIYAPPNHPEGTVHKTKEEAMAGEKH